MGVTKGIHFKTMIIMTIVSVFIISFSIVEKVTPLFVTVILLWTWMFCYSVLNIKKHPLMFCFLISFFVFLLGRQICYHYLHMKQVYEHLDVVNEYTYICICVSFLGILLGIFLSRKLNIRIIGGIGRTISNLGNESKQYKTATKLMFYFCYIGTIIGTLLQINFVRKVGYLESYSADSGGAGIPTIIIYLSKFTPVALCLFLATRPKKKEAIKALACYEIYAVLTLMTGQRYPFIGISMLILIYYILRSRFDKGWIKRYHYILLIIAIPSLMLFLTAYDAIRVGSKFSLESIIETMKDFFVQQGGSINVIRRTIYHADELQDMHFVSLQSTYSALFENAITRRLFNITTYSGNSIERAFYSNSLAHRLSYIAYGNSYLLGKGTGSSYIAELLHDFGLAGVFIGNVVYGVILTKIDNINFHHSFGEGIRLSMIYYLLVAPRAEFDSFLGNVFNLQTIIGFFAVVLLVNLVKSARAKGSKVVISEN